MKRLLKAALLLVFVCSSVVTQRVAVKCPPAKKLTDITACQRIGCGKSIDPQLNQRKNIRTSGKVPETETIQGLKDLPDPVPKFKIGDSRGMLMDLGEGRMIRVVAFALVARKGGKESCNCGLTKVQDTDNHIVLVDEPTLDLTARATRARKATAKRKAAKARTAKQNTLEVRELQSVTAEFAPRVRLDHPNLAGARLQALIAVAPRDALKVRVTGLLMFDSEHSLGHHLKRHNNWEIHPVMGLEFCPEGKTCTADSDDNWEDLEDQP
jgi:hypothetical protein